MDKSHINLYNNPNLQITGSTGKRLPELSQVQSPAENESQILPTDASLSRLTHGAKHLYFEVPG